MKLALIPATLLAGALMLATPGATLAEHREGGGRSFSRGYSEREGRFRGDRDREHFRGRDRDHDRDDRFHRGGGYYGRYSAPYYGFGFSYAPGYSYYGGYCNPNGYYDAYGNWYPDPNCSYNPYGNYGY